MSKTVSKDVKINKNKNVKSNSLTKHTKLQ